MIVTGWAIAPSKMIFPSPNLQAKGFEANIEKKLKMKIISNAILEYGRKIQNIRGGGSVSLGHGNFFPSSWPLLAHSKKSTFTTM